MSLYLVWLTRTVYDDYSYRSEIRDIKAICVSKELAKEFIQKLMDDSDETLDRIEIEEWETWTTGDHVDQLGLGSSGKARFVETKELFENFEDYLSAEYFEAIKKDSNIRRIMHPDWPSHKESIRIEGGEKTIIETMPIGKAKGVKGYCKYCYTTHSNWWEMDPRDNTLIDNGRVLLCGECEYTVLERNL